MQNPLTLLSRSWRQIGALRRATESSGAPVHVLDPDAKIRLDDGLLAIERPDQPPVRLRLPDVRAVSIHGRASITTPCVQTLLEEGIPLVWRSRTGHYLGQTMDLSGQTSRVRRAQYAAQGSMLALDVARGLIGGKIVNMRAVLRRRGADDPRIADAAAFLVAAVRRARHADGLDTLRGVEGAASAAYFACWPALLKGEAATLGFPGRRRRPPVGPVNALLSYTYAVLAGHCSAAALAAGLDPVEGLLHGDRPGRPSLALDLMEPFRPAVAESATLFALNTGEIVAGDFIDSDDGTRLTDDGRLKALHTLERRLDEAATEGQTYRNAIDRLAQSLARALVAGSAEALVVPLRA
jgi:CRISPR-associated endonuclease Cas1